MNRTDWLIVLLFGVLLLVAAIPSGGSGETSEAESGGNAETSAGDSGAGKSGGEDGEGSAETLEDDGWSSYRKQLESELAELLTRMDGVGEVQVMLTLRDSGAQVLDKSIKRDGDVSETDTVVYDRADGEEPYVTNRYTPDVEGVFIVAEGGGNAVTVSNISDAVMALFGIEAHKIKIVKMSD
jgi:stage III sporulation protein AG